MESNAKQAGEKKATATRPRVKKTAEKTPNKEDSAPEAPNENADGQGEVDKASSPSAKAGGRLGKTSKKSEVKSEDNAAEQENKGAGEPAAKPKLGAKKKSAKKLGDEGKQEGDAKGDDQETQEAGESKAENNTSKLQRSPSSRDTSSPPSKSDPTAEVVNSEVEVADVDAKAKSKKKAKSKASKKVNASATNTNEEVDAAEEESPKAQAITFKETDDSAALEQEPEEPESLQDDDRGTKSSSGTAQPAAEDREVASAFESALGDVGAILASPPRGGSEKLSASPPRTTLKTVVQAARATQIFSGFPSPVATKKPDVRTEVQQARNDGRMPPEEVSRLRALFESADVDNSETISETELKTLLEQAYKVNPSAEELSAMMSDADVDGSGEIDFDEFLYVFLRIQNGAIRCEAWNRVNFAASRIQAFLRDKKDKIQEQVQWSGGFSQDMSKKSTSRSGYAKGAPEVFCRGENSSAGSNEEVRYEDFDDISVTLEAAARIRTGNVSGPPKQSDQDTMMDKAERKLTVQQQVEQAMIDGTLSGGEIEKLRALFRVVDVDDSGNIDEVELGKLVGQCTGAVPTTQELKTMMAVVDIDRSGEVDFYEFLYLFLRLRDGTIRCAAFDKMKEAAIKIQNAMKRRNTGKDKKEETSAGATSSKADAAEGGDSPSSRIKDLQNALSNLQQLDPNVLNDDLLQHVQALQKQLEVRSGEIGSSSPSSSHIDSDSDPEDQELKDWHTLDKRELRQKLREVTAEVHDHRAKVAQAESLLDASSAVKEAEAQALAILRDERDALLEDRKQVNRELKRVQSSIRHWRQQALQRHGSLAEREEEQGRRALRGVVLALSAMRDVLLPQLDVVFPRESTGPMTHMQSPTWEEEVARKFLASCQPPSGSRGTRSTRAAVSTAAYEAPKWVERLSTPRQGGKGGKGRKRPETAIPFRP